MDFEGDGIVDHATFINAIDDNSIYYAAHTKSHFNRSIGKAYIENPNCIFHIIRVVD